MKILIKLNFQVTLSNLSCCKIKHKVFSNSCINNSWQLIKALELRKNEKT